MEEPHPHTTPDEPTHDPPPAPLHPSPSIPEPAPQPPGQPEPGGPPAHDPPLYPEHDRQEERRAPDAPQGHTDLPPDAIVYDESRTPG